MKVYDRSGIAEHFILQLWEKNYFSTLHLTSTTGSRILIISAGERNHDAGPDFRNAVIKIDEQIFRGDVEIHRAPEDWYQHGHHTDPAYHNVILHLIIGKQTSYEPAIRLDYKRVPAEIFIDIPEEKFSELIKQYRLLAIDESEPFLCQLSEISTEKKIEIIDYFSQQRFNDKSERFLEMRQFSSWNQIFYAGMMEALGYSKNQIPFRKLAFRLPFEALQRETENADAKDQLLYLQAMLFGVAGLLPSQNPSHDWRKIKDQSAVDYLHKLEQIWENFSQRLGIEPLRREEWLFFRLRPANFPTRRIAGASLLLHRFFDSGFLQKLLQIVRSSGNNLKKLRKEIVKLFICETTGYWAKYYTFADTDEQIGNAEKVLLIGRSRATDIVINVVLPALYAYASEINDTGLKSTILQLYQNFPRSATNTIEKKMWKRLFDKKDLKRMISNAARQQGLIQLNKLYCQRNECDICLKVVKSL